MNKTSDNRKLNLPIDGKHFPRVQLVEWIPVSLCGILMEWDISVPFWMYKSVPTPCCLIWAADLPVEQIVAVSIHCKPLK